VWKQLDGLFRFGASGHIGDDELLGRFVAGRRDEAAEAAFAALVERHGPMVLGVCRRVLGDRHEAEDAFQATFLVLARKAGAIARREQLANWLHGVASRTALDARSRADRRRARERKASGLAVTAAEAGPGDGPERGELRAILDEELARLPASYRGPVILCELDGLSRQVAARRLGIPEGTLSSRLARAKDLLRYRLMRRGLAPSVIALEAALAHEARALILPPSLAGPTVEAAARVAAGASLAEAVSASVVTLTQGALHTMLLAKIKGMAFALAAAAVGTAGVGVMAQAPGPGPGGQDDRLGAVEKKLDRILEALGSRRPDDAERDPFQEHRGAPGAAPVLPGGAPAGTGAGSGAEGAPAMRPDAPRPTGMSYPADMARMQSAMRGMMGQQMANQMAARGGWSSTEPRLAELERRVADLERRLDAMERRLPPAALPGSAGAARPGAAPIGPPPQADVAKPAP
jgi:RNA polymerase sigma factor (sigma-70 family)